MKYCANCGLDKSMDDFYKNQNRCKECQKQDSKQHYSSNKQECDERWKVYYQKNKETLLIKDREHQRANREYYREKNKEWYKDNKEHRRIYNKQYRIDNKERINLMGKKWMQNNRAKCTSYTQNRKALKNKLQSTLTIEQWGIIKKDFNNQCAYCGKIKKLEQEHFIPLIKNGEYTHNNIIPSCKSCNCKKATKDFFEWYPQYENYSLARQNKILEYLNYKDKNIQQLSIL